MSNVKKVIALGTTLATVLWSFGGVIPAGATVISNGDLVKTADSPAVYLIQGSQRRVFPHANVYHSWGYPADFSTVKTVSASELNAYEEGNPVPFRDGSLFRGTTTSFEGYDKTAVFYVEDAKIRPIKSAEIYQELFDDPNWELVTWVPDDLLSKFAYPEGSMIESADKHPDGCLVKYEDSDTIYLIQDGKKREITPEAIEANRLSNYKIFTISEDETYPDGTKITGAEEALLTPGWSTVVSGLTVSLASDSPEAANVPLKAQNVEYTKVKIVNGSAPAQISSITVKRSGLGTYNDFAKIGIFEGETQHGVYKTLSSATDTATFNFSTPISLAANETKYLSIRASLGGNESAANHSNKLGITAISSDATVSGLPVYGNEMTGVSLNIADVTVTYMSVDDSTPNVGQDGVELADLKFASTDNDEDVELISFILEQKGTLKDSEVSNVGVYYQDTKLGDCSVANDKYTCILDTPLEIAKNKSKRVRVIGDIEGGDAGDTCKLAFDSKYDINVLGKSYGYRADITISDSTDPAELTLQAGDVTVNFNFLQVNSKNPSRRQTSDKRVSGGSLRR